MKRDVFKLDVSELGLTIKGSAFEPLIRRRAVVDLAVPQSLQFVPGQVARVQSVTV